jgi:hypothetical protein
MAHLREFTPTGQGRCIASQSPPHRVKFLPGPTLQTMDRKGFADRDLKEAVKAVHLCGAKPKVSKTTVSTRTTSTARRASPGHRRTSLCLDMITTVIVIKDAASGREADIRSHGHCHRIVTGAPVSVLRLGELFRDDCRPGAARTIIGWCHPPVGPAMRRQMHFGRGLLCLLRPVSCSEVRCHRSEGRPQGGVVLEARGVAPAWALSSSAGRSRVRRP